MKRARKNREPKEHISVQSTVSVTVSSCANNRNGYIGKFMTDAGFTARLGRQVSIFYLCTRNHESQSWLMGVKVY